MQILAFIIVFNVIVFIHEFGHFYIAKRNDILVHEFSLGMGPAIISKTIGETKYSFRIFPIGGYVKMEGEDEISDNERSFSSKSVLQRISVVVAGPLMNFILAILLFIGLNLYSGVPNNTISELVDGFPAKEAGIVSGDIITNINNKDVKNWDEAVKIISSQTEEMKIEVKRDNEIKSFKVKPIVNDKGQGQIGIIRGREYSFVKSITHAFSFFYQIILSMLSFFGNLFRGAASSADVVGPVGLFGVISDATKMGIAPLIMLTAFISLNLGIINLLPLPALDGGRIFFMIIELIRGKAISQEKEGLIHGIGFLLLLCLIIFITYKDIVKLL